MCLVPPENFSQAISAGDYKLLRDYAFQIREHISTYKNLPENYFSFILDLPNDQKFLELGGAWYLLIIFNNKEFLASDQKERLVPFIQFAYEVFYDMNPEIIKEALNDAIKSANTTQIEECCLTIDVFFLSVGAFRDDWFDFILSLLDKKELLNLQKGSSNLLWLFESSWSYLSNDQKKRMLPVLERNYSLFKDCDSHEKIASLLGEYFCNDASFETLRRLSKIREEQPRSSVPYGFEHIISDSKDRYLPKMAWVELQRMKKDSSELVRNEVKRSMQNLKYKNIKAVNINK
jgi:hypothetical protein